MSLLAFWSAPLDEDTDQIKLSRGTSTTGPWDYLTTLAARDGYGNWVTHYEDTSAPSAAYYRAEFLKEGLLVCTEAVQVKAGVTPYEVTPQMVLDFDQGLPQNRVSAELVNRIIGHAIDILEVVARMKFSLTTATREVYSSKTLNKVVGGRTGVNIQLRHFPVYTGGSTIATLEYRVRGANPGSQIQSFGDIDVQIAGGNGPDDYNRGMISVYPRQASVSALYTVLALSNSDKIAVDLLISYTHGWSSWPPGINEAVTKLAAAGAMEIAGEAETAGLSSRSVDGYSESYTASATTTVFSARRIWYEDTVKKTMKHIRKPIWG